MPFARARSAMSAPTLTAAVLLAALFASPRTPASRDVACASVVPAASSTSCTEIQRSVLLTARRGRSAVPLTFVRMRAWMRVLASTRACAFSMVRASLLARGLAGLLLEDLAHEAESLQLVRIGRANAADLGRRLADLLLVDARDDDVRDVLGLRVRCHFDLDALRHRKLHDVRKADAEHDGRPLDLGLEADAHEVDLALETFGDAENRVLEERPVQAVERLVLFLLSSSREADQAVLLLDRDARENGCDDGASRTLHRDRDVRDLDIDTLRNGDGLLTDSRHVAPHHTVQTTSPPTPRFFASWPVRRPCEVDTMATPRPPRTSGSSFLPAKRRRPGLLERA